MELEDHGLRKEYYGLFHLGILFSWNENFGSMEDRGLQVILVFLATSHSVILNIPFT